MFVYNEFRENPLPNPCSKINQKVTVKKHHPQHVNILSNTPVAISSILYRVCLSPICENASSTFSINADPYKSDTRPSYKKILSTPGDITRSFGVEAARMCQIAALICHVTPGDALRHHRSLLSGEIF